MTAADEPHFDAWADSCSSDADCTGEGQQCTFIYWVGTDDEKNFANGSACYNWDAPVCPSEGQWGSINENYTGGTEFSYYTQFQCAGEGDAAIRMAVSVIATSALAIAAMV